MILYHRHNPCHNISQQKPPLIILHGFLGSSGNWLGIAKELSQQTEVWSFDLRNHGLSSQSEEIDYNVMAQDVVETFRANNIKKPILLGHSMGGKVVMKASDMYQNEIAGLIVADIAPQKYQDIPAIEIVKKLEKIDTTAFSSRPEMLEKMEKVFQNKILANFLLKNIKIDTKKKCLHWRIPIKILSEKSEFLKEDVTPKNPVNLPTLFLRGEKSNYIKKEQIAPMKKSFPRSDFCTIAKAGHWLHADNKEDVIEKIQHFIRSF